MRKDIILPAVAAGAGALGFGLRRWQMSSGFEPDTGLAIPGAPAAVALVACSAALAVLLLLLAWGSKERMGWKRAFQGAENCPVYMTAMVLAAFLLLGSAGIEVLAYPGSFQTAQAAESWGVRTAAAVLPPLRILLCLGGCPCVLVWAKNLYRRGEGGKESLPLLELCFLFCVWLVSNYQSCAADPVVMNYIWEVLAICFSLLGLYYVASYSFLKEGHPRRTVLVCLMAVFFSLTAMGGKLPVSELLRCGFSALFLGGHAALILQEHPAGETAEAPDCTEEKEAEDNA